MSSGKKPPAPPGLLEQVAALGNLRQAWQAVRERRGGPGVDRVRIQDYTAGVEERLVRLSGRLLDESYRPAAVLRIYPEHDPKRPLSIPTIEDRLAQRAVAAVLGPRLEPTFSPASYAYRPRRSVEHALAVVQRHLDAGLRFFLRSDIAKFFDRIDQERLLAALAPDVPDPRLLRLVGRFVRAQVLEGASSDLLELGVPQGSALSPLLSNVYLRPFDEAVLAAGYPLVRYADDLLVLCRTFEQTGEALDLLSRQVEALDLELGPKKTRRGNIGEGFVFLGVHFGPAGRGPARKALQALSERGQTILAEEQEPEAAAAALAGLLQRWEAYHGELAGPDHPGCALLLGSLAQLQPATTAAARLEELALARRRLAAAPLPAGTSPAPAWLHLALAEAWAAHGHADGLLLEAAAVLRAAGRRLDPAWRSRLLAALVVPERHAAAVLDALAHPPVGLAAALGQAGCTALADAVRQGLFAAGEEEEPGRPPRQGRLPEPAEQLVQRLAALFTGRAGVHAMLLKDRRGHLRLVPVERELEAEGWRAHLAGRRTLGLYPVRSDGTLRVGAAVFRLPRAALADAAQGSVLGAQLTDAACRLARAAEQLQLPCLIEEAGRRERRVWLLFAGPLAQRDARALLVRLSNEAGPVDPPLRLELLPATDRPGRAPGPLVTLPLAGRACGLEQARLLDVAGRALSDPTEVLRTHVPIPVLRVHDLVRRGPLAAPAQQQEEPVAVLLRDLPRPLRIAERCSIVAGLIEKARDLGHLEAEERRSLLELLGHLAAQGREALLRIQERCGKPEARELDRKLAALPRMPISCARLRGRHARVLGQRSCACTFPGLQGRGYPTPLLLTLRPHEIGGFVGPAGAGRERGQPGRRSPAPAQPACPTPPAAPAALAAPAASPAAPATSRPSGTAAPRQERAAVPRALPPRATAPAELPQAAAPAGQTGRTARPAQPLRTVMPAQPPRTARPAQPPGAAAPAARHPQSPARPARSGPTAWQAASPPQGAGPLAELGLLARRLREQRQRLAEQQRDMQRSERELAALLAVARLQQVELEGLRFTLLVGDPQLPPRLRVEWSAAASQAEPAASSPRPVPQESQEDEPCPSS